LESDGEPDTEDKLDTQLRKKKSKRPTAGDLDIYRRRIVENAKPHLRSRIATKNPCPGGPQIDVWMTDSWLAGFKEAQQEMLLDDNTMPSDDELGLVRLGDNVYINANIVAVQLKQIFSQHRGAIKTEARGFVKQYYGFEVGAGQFTTDDVKNKNRDIYDVLMTKMAFVYKVHLIFVLTLSYFEIVFSVEHRFFLIF
jgi:hypothetical protein